MSRLSKSAKEFYRRRLIYAEHVGDEEAVTAISRILYRQKSLIRVIDPDGVETTFNTRTDIRKQLGISLNAIDGAMWERRPVLAGKCKGYRIERVDEE